LLHDVDPARVFVLLNAGDFGRAPLETSWLFRMRVKSDLSIEIKDVRPGGTKAAPPPPAQGVHLLLRNWGLTPSHIYTLRSRAYDLSPLPRSILWTDVMQRYKEINNADSDKSESGNADDDDPTVALVPLASVRALKQSYGDRLVVIFVPEIDAASTAAA